MEVPKLKEMLKRMLLQACAIVLVAAALGILTNYIRRDGLPLVADWPLEAQLTPEPGESLVLSLAEARESFSSGAAVFLDARAPELYEQGHIQGARSLPWEKVAEYFDEVMAGIPLDALIIAYCDGETCSLSKDLALELFYRGYENVRVLVNGWSLWKDHRLPIGIGASPGS